MNPKQFLMLGGLVLVLLAVLGFVDFRLGELLWFDQAENWAHLVLGVVALAASYLADAKTQRLLTQVVGVVALVVGVLGFFVAGAPEPNFYGVANLENPVDNVLHLVVGVWGLYVGFMVKEAQTA